RVPGDVGTGGQQRGPAGQTAEEQVARYVGLPGGGLDHGPAVVRGELRVGDHRGLPPPAPLPALPATRRSGRLRHAAPVAGGCGGHRRRSPAKVATAPASRVTAATAAWRHIRGRCAVLTTGSGGSP